MSDQRASILSGPLSARLGIVSLIAAFLAWASVPLIVLFGLALALCALLLLALTSVVTGLVGVGAGICDRNSVAIITALLGLLLVSCLGVLLSHAMNF